MKLAGARVLITQAHLVRYMGSEIVTLEMAEYFDSMGADVVVVTHSFGGDLRVPFSRLSHVRVFELPDPELAELWKTWTPDLAWIQHSILPKAVLERADQITFFFHHMSAYLPIERPLAPGLEAALSTVSTFISEETMAHQLASGLYAGIEPERLQTFENPAPARFQRERETSRMARLLVVSNHIPHELIEALGVLRASWDITIVGAQRELGATPRLVDPELLADADAVVTIGKTVPFAISSGVPVYLYDHFGGPGWLSEENIRLARRNGFSGRGFSRKSSEEICTEIAEHRETAFDRFRKLVTQHGADFRLPERMDSLLSFADAHPRQVAVPDASAIRTHDNVLAAFGSYVREWVRMEGSALSGAVAQRELDRYRAIPGSRVVKNVWGRVSGWLVRRRRPVGRGSLTRL